MKPIAIAVILGCLVGYAAAQSETPTPSRYAGQLQSDIQSEKAIRDLYSQFTAAWNKHDVPTMAGMWVEDGDQVDPDGHVAKGRAEVTQLLTAQHNGVFKGTHLTLTVESVWMLTSNVALVDGTYELTGAHTPDGKELPARKGRLSSILLNERSRWWIAASRLMIPAPLPWRKS